MLTVKDLHVSYGQIKALRGVSLSLERGELLAIIGANGAGKSTLLNTIAGRYFPTAGSIHYDGQDITRLPAPERVRRGLMLVPEGRGIFDRLTVVDNLRMGAYCRRDGQAVKRDIEAVLGRFPALHQRRNQPAGSLSGGEKQMLAVGRGLMARPRLLLLDEPSLGLAPLLVKQVFTVVSELRQEGITICLVEQNAKQALKIADRAYVMEIGCVSLTGKASELAENEAVKEAYLGGGARGGGSGS